MRKKAVPVLLVLCAALTLLSAEATAANDNGESVKSSTTYSVKITGKDSIDYGDELSAELESLNTYRKEQGKSELKDEGSLDMGAMQRAVEIALYYDHTRPDHSESFTVMTDFPYVGEPLQVTGENIAVGYSTVEEVMEAWKDSAGHNENMLSEAYQSVGLGCFSGSNGTKYWVQLFSGDKSEVVSSGGGGGGIRWHNVKACADVLDLCLFHDRTSMKPGEELTVALCNNNKGHEDAPLQLAATYAVSSDETVASVQIDKRNGDVVITAVAGGTATIKLGLAATEENCAPMTVDVPVAVLAAPVEQVLVSQGFDLSEGEELYYGNTCFRLLDNQSIGGGWVTYRSEDPSVVTVDGDGRIIAVGVGETTITATAAAVEGKYLETSVSFPLTVRPLPVYTGDVTYEDKVYDGTTGLVVTDMEFFDDTVEEGQEPIRIEGLKLGEDYTVTAGFDTPDAGDGKRVDGVVTMLNPNYTVVDDGEFWMEDMSISKAWYTGKRITVVMKKEPGYSRTVDLAEGFAGLPGLLPEGISSYVLMDTGEDNVPFVWKGIEKPALEGPYMTLTGAACDDYTAPDVTDWVGVLACGDNWEVGLSVHILYTEETPVLLSGVTVQDKVYDRSPAEYIGDLKAVLATDPAQNVTDMGEKVIGYYWHSVEEGNVWLPMEEVPVNAGEYVLAVILTAEDYAGVLNIPFTIERAPVTVRADNVNLVSTAGGGGNGENVGGGAALPVTAPTSAYRVEGPVAEEDWLVKPATSCPTLDPDKGGTYPLIVGGGALTEVALKNCLEPVYINGTFTFSVVHVPTPDDKPTGGDTPSGGGSASSGGGGSIPRYGVSLPANVKNGAVNVSPQKAKAGDTVTVTLKADKGYRMKELVITDQNGKTVTLKDLGDGTFSFVMPSSKVSIKVSFEEDKPEEKQPEKEPQEDTPNIVPVAERFSDVGGGWFEQAVQFVCDKGMMNGMSECEFVPHATSDRAMLVTILYRLEGEPQAGEGIFTDVKKGQYYSGAVAWAAANGIVGGFEDGSFRPNGAVTREQLVTILYRYAGKKGYGEKPGGGRSFTDGASISIYAREAVQWATENGIVNGYEDGSFRPSGSATRAELAAILMRFCEKVMK